MYSDQLARVARPLVADEQASPWGQVLDHLAGVVASGASVVVDSDDGQASLVADRLAATLQAAGRPCARLTDTNPLADEDAWLADRTRETVAVADGPRWRRQPPTGRWDVVIWVRTAHEDTVTADRVDDVDIVVDLYDSSRPFVSRPARASGGERGIDG